MEYTEYRLLITENCSSAALRLRAAFHYAKEEKMDILSDLLRSFDPANPNFRPTEIYNECWLIKLVLLRASTIQEDNFPLGFQPGSSWFSEGLLPTAFKARFQGDPLSESRTNADGVIGQIKIGQKGKADLELDKDATQFTVIEAKVGSPLSPGITHAKYYDQAARSVACMAEVLKMTGKDPSSLKRLEFIVLAPQYSIDKSTFSEEMDKASIRSKVQKRVAGYDGERNDWYRNHFEPALENIRLHSLSWESALEWISDHNPGVANQLGEFYDLCLQFK